MSDKTDKELIAKAEAQAVDAGALVKSLEDTAAEARSALSGHTALLEADEAAHGKACLAHGEKREIMKAERVGLVEAYQPLVVKLKAQRGLLSDLESRIRGLKAGVAKRKAEEEAAKARALAEEAEAKAAKAAAEAAPEKEG